LNPETRIKIRMIWILFFQFPLEKRVKKEETKIN